MNPNTPIITNTAIMTRATIDTVTAAATVDTVGGYLSTPIW